MKQLWVETDDRQALVNVSNANAVWIEALPPGAKDWYALRAEYGNGTGEHCKFTLVTGLKEECERALYDIKLTLHHTHKVLVMEGEE